jgi:hydrogenase expression/formation protein HypE
MSDKLGKIDLHVFEELVSDKCGARRSEVLIPPQFGVDVSVVSLGGEMAMALSSDPLSLIPALGLEESAWLSVQLLNNDMATTGFAPMYGQFVLNLPAQFSKDDFKIYWDHIHRFCLQAGMAITGGHTGFIEGQNSTIAGGGTFITVAPEKEILTSRYARTGDAILVTKTCAISSAAILAMCFPDTVKNKLGVNIYHDACETFYHTSSLQDALCAVEEHNAVTAMHDVTEGGVLGAIYELATASGNGAVIYNDNLPVDVIQNNVCKLFSLDPRYCVGAGAMIITCKKEKVKSVMGRLAAKQIRCTEVGELTAKEQGIKLVEDGKRTDISYQQEDPYWAAFFRALHLGWK